MISSTFIGPISLLARSLAHALPSPFPSPPSRRNALRAQPDVAQQASDFVGNALHLLLLHIPRALRPPTTQPAPTPPDTGQPPTLPPQPATSLLDLALANNAAAAAATASGTDGEGSFFYGGLSLLADAVARMGALGAEVGRRGMCEGIRNAAQ